jgi:Uma2 family endonuclease
MSGGTIEHARLASKLGFLLQRALEAKPCRVFSSDARVRVEVTNRSTYPDVTGVCGEIRRAKDDAQALTNPVLVAEVLSESTERADRGEKFAHYRRLEALLDYVLVSPDAQRVEVFHREKSAWILREARRGETIELPGIGVTIDVEELFREAITD